MVSFFFLNEKCHGFSSSRTWESMRPKEMAKDWSKSVWFKGSVPKHAFNMWVAHLNRLPTRQRLATWGICASTSCCLCSQQTETRDHLLITCDFSAVIWNLVFNRLSPTQLLFSTWAELLSWTRRRSAIAPSLLRKIVSLATVFHLWKQRNNVLHNARLIPSQIIFNGIDREVRNTITARRHKRQWRPLMPLGSDSFPKTNPHLTQRNEVHVHCLLNCVSM